MDSFITITTSAPFANSISEETTTQVEFESHGGSGGGYCVISHSVSDEELNQVEFEKHGGSGGGYCVIA